MRRMYSLKQLQEIANVQIQQQLSSGNLVNVKVFENIVDKNGHRRFIEGNGTPATISGFTPSYCKWSLSGTHLMLVLAGSFENETIIESNSNLADFNLPSWILEKIYPVWATIFIETKVITLNANDWTQQTLSCVLGKFTNSLVINTLSGGLTLTAKRAFRIQFDLLIDNEE